jgi:hypothetical protein
MQARAAQAGFVDSACFIGRAGAERLGHHPDRAGPLPNHRRSRHDVVST